MPHPARLAAATAGAVVLGLVGAPTTAAVPGPPEELHSLSHQQAEARIGSGDGVLERGCQRHRYRYRVQAPESQWSLELFLVDPDGQKIASGYEWKGADPARGRGWLEFCAQVTRPGRFTVKARLTWDDGEYHEKRLEPQRIRLRRN